MRFVLWELENTSADLAGIFNDAFRNFGFSGNPIVMRIEKAIEDKEIRPIDPKNFILNLLGMCIFPFVAAPLLIHILPGFDLENPGFIEEREKAILDVIIKDIEMTN